MDTSRKLLSSIIANLPRKVKRVVFVSSLLCWKHEEDNDTLVQHVNSVLNFKHATKTISIIAKATKWIWEDSPADANAQTVVASTPAWLRYGTEQLMLSDTHLVLHK